MVPAYVHHAAPVTSAPMNQSASARSRWVWGVRGLVTIAFGVVALAAPSQTLEALAVWLGAFLLGTGIATLLVGARTAGEGGMWLTPLLLGALEVALGVAAFTFPGVSAVALLWPVLAVFWALVSGALLLLAARQLRRAVPGEWLLPLIGGLSVVLAVVLALFPLPGVQPIAWTFGAYAVVSGSLLLALAEVLRRGARVVQPEPPARVPTMRVRTRATRRRSRARR